MSAGARRESWLDALRILAAFWVIVNHTNSYVFKAAAPCACFWCCWFFPTAIMPMTRG